MQTVHVLIRPWIATSFRRHSIPLTGTVHLASSFYKRAGKVLRKHTMLSHLTDAVHSLAILFHFIHKLAQ